MWTGLLALLGCLWGWIQLRQRQAFLILYFFAIFYFSWALIPRKIEFYYYYYPAGMVLSLALAYCFYHPEVRKRFRTEKPLQWIKWSYLGIAIALFAYFFPILAALQIPLDSFRRWMWFNSWI
jgi:dolichyl-phosphate-mannose-protein mannosyltransferase